MLTLTSLPQKVALRHLAWAAAVFTIAFIPEQRLEAATDTTAGEQIFSACAACHGLDGKGGEHAPNIATDPNVRQMSDRALLEIIRKGIPAAGMPAFSLLLNDEQIQSVLRYLRFLQSSGSKADVTGDANNGHALFFGHAGCASCHMVNGRGGFFGSDLSDYGGGNHSAAAIREAIVAPDKNQDPRHGTVTVVTRDKATYRGALRNEDNFSLQMQTPDGEFHFFAKDDLARIEHESTSLMPHDYGSKLTNAELNDLISFLSQTGGKKKPNAEEDEE